MTDIQPGRRPRVPGFERRIGLRTDVPGLPVTWVPDPKPGSGGPAPTSKRARRRNAELRDLSITGASMVTKQERDLVKGARVVVRIGDALVPGTVKRAEAVDATGYVLLGLEFRSLDGTLLELVHNMTRAKPAVGTSWDAPST